MSQNKLYCFIVNSHYHVITKIDEDKFGVVDFCTARYTDERFSTLEECLKWANKNWKVKEFDTYKKMFEYFLESENTLEMIDIFKVKNIIDRQTMIDSDGYVDKVREEIFKEKGI